MPQNHILAVYLCSNKQIFPFCKKQKLDAKNVTAMKNIFIGKYNDQINVHMK